MTIPKGAAKKAILLQKLKEALELKMPVFPLSQLGNEKEKDDMSVFMVGAKWVELTPDVDVPEPINEGFPMARAPTVPAKDAKIQPRPKQNFEETFDRPLFTGCNPDGSVRTEGCPKVDFLCKHQLQKDLSPIEFAKAFFPMYANTVLDQNGDPHLSMEYLTQNTNLWANLAFAGEAVYEDQWSGPFSVKEL